jgi:hypothetical protein
MRDGSIGSGSPAGTGTPTCRGFAEKRLKGFEPSTFCMATTPISESRRYEYGVLQVFPPLRETAPGSLCAAICVDMRRFGHWCARVPEIAEAGLIARLPGLSPPRKSPETATSG